MTSSRTPREIGGAVGENLRKVRDWLPQARELLTIKCDVALPARVERSRAARRRTPRSSPSCSTASSFKTWQRELQEAGSASVERGATERGAREAAISAARAVARPSPPTARRAPSANANTKRC